MLKSQYAYSSVNDPVRGSSSFHCPIDMESPYLHPPGLEYPGISILHCTIQLRLVSAFISEEVSPNTLLILGTKP